jgi:hypothetical protein
MRTLELNKIQNCMNVMDFEIDFVGKDNATYMRLTV